MPKVVDHQERRQELVEAAWRVINRVGLDAVTIREIAREARCSPGALAHYFPTKDAILRSALERADDEIRHRLQQIPGDTHPATCLRRVLLEALPVDDIRAFELSLDVNFWARALNQPSLRELQHRDHESWRTIVIERVEAAQAAGDLTDDHTAADITDVLIAFVDGLGVQGLVYPELLTRSRIARLLDAQLMVFGADPRFLVDDHRVVE